MGYNKYVKLWSGIYFPNTKKASFFLAILVLLLAGAALTFLIKGGGEPKPKPAPLSLLNEEQKKKLNQDSDNDGLKDWEEILFGTNTQKPDTDDDGTNDGEEVKLGRDPAKAGPDDKLVLPAEQTTSSDAARSATARFSSAILPEVVGSILAGNPLQVDDLISRIESYDLGNRESVWKEAPQYSLKDIKKSPKNDIGAILNMFIALNNAAVKHIGPVADGKDPIIDFIQNVESPENKEKFIAYQEAFKNLIAEIRNIPAPQEYQEFMLAYLNALSKINYALSLIGNIEKDPISALLVMSGASAAQEEFAAVVRRAADEAKTIAERKIKEFAETQQRK